MDYLAKVNQIEKEEKTRNISISVKSEISACRAKEAKEAKEALPRLVVRDSIDQDPPHAVTTGQEGLPREQGERSRERGDVVIEPAATNARQVYWERATGIVGPAQPEFLAMVGTGLGASYWVVAQFEGAPVWINAAALRSKQAYATQVLPVVVELIHEAPLLSGKGPRSRTRHHRKRCATLDVATLL